MIEFKEALFKLMAIHNVGNSSSGHPLMLTDKTVMVHTEVFHLLVDHFLEPFKDRESYAFDFANGEVDLNACYNLVKRIFEYPDHLLTISQDLARHLYDAAVHPNIKDGDFCVVRFDQVIYEDEITDALVLCKSETMDTFLQFLQEGSTNGLQAQTGIPVGQLDKGCLIINTNSDSGYQVYIIDQANKSIEAQYWRKFFLNVTPRSDQFHQTAHLMQMTKSFIHQNLGDQRQIDKTDQVHYLNKSMEYLHTHEQVNVHDFTNEVFDDPVIQGVFAQFQSNYLAENQMEMEPVFDVSEKAVKKYSRVFKSVLKLDKNFHIYIHGDRSLIEKGMDEDGRKYYKLYYQDEL